MFLTEKIAVKIGNNAKLFLNIDNDKEQIIIYGAINLLQMIFDILWIAIFGLLFGVFYEALLFSITASILRKYSGGVHASSPSRCIIIGTTVATIAGIFIDKILYKLNMFTVLLMSLVFIIFSLIIVLKSAPVDSIKKPITDIKLKKQFKKNSIIVIFLSLLIIIVLFILKQRYSNLYYIKFIEAISIGILWQAITLAKGGISLLSKVDFALKYIFEGGENYGK